MATTAIIVGAMIAAAVIIIKIHDVQAKQEIETAKAVALIDIQERIARNRRESSVHASREEVADMIEFCGNCQTGADTHEEYPGACPFYRKASDKHCANHEPLRYRPADGRMVYVASPLRGDIEGNLRKAAAYCRAASEVGVVPIAPHLYFSAFLDDRKPKERAEGMAMGLHALRRCDELWVFGEPSEGMKAEIKLAKSLNIPILYIPEETARQIAKGNSAEGG